MRAPETGLTGMSLQTGLTILYSWAVIKVLLLHAIAFVALPALAAMLGVLSMVLVRPAYQAGHRVLAYNILFASSLAGAVFAVYLVDAGMRWLEVELSWWLFVILVPAMLFNDRRRIAGAGDPAMEGAMSMGSVLGVIGGVAWLVL